MPMQPNKIIALFGLFNALMLGTANHSASAGPEKRGEDRRGAGAAVQMSAKGRENTNAQWSADPDHGWVRADERHELQARRKSDEGSKQGREKQKGKADKTEKLTKKGNY